ncbi:metalloregulator ArsR/SmtB family transcription factor [Pusillimonas sp. NJUB218]|uniref:metalloregulator ArsR/SmtB family transcription factor n=1 Tax=Pusillimonas sp. NJUB218 TaxID=2023230 RepID=UPI0026981E9A
MMTTTNPVSFFKCMSDETRARIMLLLAAEGELCVCDLTVALDEGQSKVSRHLAQLRNCGLLEDRRDGQWVYYRVAPSLPDWATALFTQLRIAYAQWLATDAARLKQSRKETGSACS